MAEFAVIGLGRFGSSVARSLYDLGHNVLAMDKSEDALHEVVDHVTHAVQIDSTDPDALRAVGITNFDAVVVAIGVDIQESILTTMLLKDLGVKKVVAKAVDERQGKVLEKVGADTVVFPERDMGVRVAHSLATPNLLEYLELSPQYTIDRGRARGGGPAGEGHLISSTKNPLGKSLGQWHDRRHREVTGRFLVDGVRLVE